MKDLWILILILFSFYVNGRRNRVEPEYILETTKDSVFIYVKMDTIYKSDNLPRTIKLDSL